MRSTVRDMARSGLRRVTFDSGYSRRLDSQARMNILEGVRRLNGDMMEETGKEFGADGVEISVHGLCAPDHQSIQGRQFSSREYERLNERLQRPIGTLNCHHFTTPIILGVSKPVHSVRELEEINARSNAPVEYKGRTMTRYEASQKQRQLETAIRYAKDERDACVAAGDKIGSAQARKRSAALGSEYKSFCEQAGLTPRPERTRSMTGPTVEKTPKPLDKTEKSDIMRSSGESAPPDRYTLIDRTWKIDPANEDKISETIEDFASSFSDSEKEHSIVITKDGKVFSLTGTSISVDPSVIGAEKLLGSIGVHNHPVPPGEACGDSFSRADLMFSAKHRTGIEYLVSGGRRNAFEFLQEYTEEEIYRAWEKAFQVVRERAISGELIIDWEQEEILKVLAEQLEGFIFYENF